MARPRDVPVVDLMLMLPGTDGGLRTVQRVARDKGSAEMTHHPAQYMFKAAPQQEKDIDQVVAMMDEYGVGTALVGVDAQHPETSLALFDKYPTRFIGEVSVDPNQGMDAVRQLEATVKLHPNIVAAWGAPCLLNPQVPIDDKRWYPIYAKCIELDIPIGMLVGVPGPRVPFKCQHPELLDEVAWFFPELRVVMRHGGDPFTDLCCKLLLKWPNLYYSTSAWAPKHYPRNIIDFANKRGPDKFLYAGYYPFLSYERIFGEMDDLPLRDASWRPFLRDNAIRVYGLDRILS